MSWNDVSTVAVDIKKHRQEPYIGKYEGHKEITTKIGPQVIWQFIGQDGVPFGVYGFTNLNRAMETLEPGSVVRITYTGTINTQTKFGMKDVHQCTVQVWTPDAEGEKPEAKKDPLADLPF